MFNAIKKKGRMFLAKVHWPAAPLSPGNKAKTCMQVAGKILTAAHKLGSYQKPPALTFPA